MFSVYLWGMATQQKPKARKARNRAPKVEQPVLDPVEAQKQAAYERRQALRVKQGIEQH